MRTLSIIAVFLCVAALAAPTVSAADNTVTGWVQNHGKVNKTAQAKLPPASRKSSAGTAGPNAQTVYTTRAAFDAAAPGLDFEDYETGNVGPGGVSGCISPMTSTTNDPPCVDPGDIHVNLDIVAVSAGVLAMAGAGFSGNPTITVVSNYFTDSTDFQFSAAPFAFGADLQSFFGASTLTITCFNGATLIGTFTAPASNAGTFWGVTDDVNAVTRVNVFDTTGANAEGADNISFGNFVPVELESFQVE